MRIIKQFLLCLAAGLFVGAQAGYCAGQSLQLDKEKELAADAVIRAEMKERSIAGTSIAVVRNGRVIMTKGFGLANIEAAIDAGPNTRYQIGSSTKPFTAIAILMLVEAGKVGLDEKIAKYLSRVPSSYSGVTIRQLLTHTSGVARDLRTSNTDDFTIDEFWRRLAVTPKPSEPGARWEYSNTGYILLGLLIESVAKRSYGEFLSESIFRPLGMTSTSYLEPIGKNRTRALGYDWVENAFRPSPYFSGGFAAGGLVSTVTDLARWDAALDTEKLLKRSSLEQMWKPTQLGDGKKVSFDFRGHPTSYGLGWFLTEGDQPRAFHGGTVSGFSSQIIRLTNDKITIIVTSNTKSGPDRFGHAEILAEKIAAIYAGQSRK